MNVRFSSNEMRCRINKEELNLLLSGEDVSLDLSLFFANNQFIILSGSSTITQKLQIITKNSTIKIIILKSSLEDLASRLPTKHGIIENIIDSSGNDVNLIVEVDLMDR